MKGKRTVTKIVKRVSETLPSPRISLTGTVGQSNTHYLKNVTAGSIGCWLHFRPPCKTPYQFSVRNFHFATFHQKHPPNFVSPAIANWRRQVSPAVAGRRQFSPAGAKRSRCQFFEINRRMQ